MPTPFYHYPVQTARLMQPRPAGQAAGDHPTCALGYSIAQFLYLLLHTQPGELRSAPDFGCAIWELEFSTHVRVSHWEETLTRSLLLAVRQHEPRLHEPRVELTLSATAPPPGQGLAADLPARWYGQVLITGVVALTQEPFSFRTQLYVGRLAA